MRWNIQHGLESCSLQKLKYKTVIKMGLIESLDRVQQISCSRPTILMGLGQDCSY